MKIKRLQEFWCIKDFNLRKFRSNYDLFVDDENNIFWVYMDDSLIGELLSFERKEIFINQEDAIKYLKDEL